MEIHMACHTDEMFDEINGVIAEHTHAHQLEATTKTKLSVTI